MSVPKPKFTTTPTDDGFSPQDKETIDLYKEVEAYAMQGQPIMIFGPTGAGKEFLARHYYNTLIKTEFYKQYKENWPSHYKNIKKEYENNYGEGTKSIKIFLESLKAGVFDSINSATINPNLAESILFGHEAGSFTGAIKTQPGLLESLKCGVLFLDEIGELPKLAQAKLLRAVDEEIKVGRRMSGAKDYSLKDLIVISATNRPRNWIRKDLYFKFGFDVEIKGVDERPKDIAVSIPYFISKAIGKRKDYAAVIAMFGIHDLRDISKLSKTTEVKAFALEQSELVTGGILERKWSGNFRAIRKALDASIMTIVTPDDIDNFAEAFRNNLPDFISKYSDDSSKTMVGVTKTLSHPVFPSPFPRLDKQIRSAIYSKNIFPKMGDFEMNVLSVFLSSKHKTGFKSRELGDCYARYDAIKYSSETTIRNRINALSDEKVKILTKKESSKNTRYHLSEDFLKSLASFKTVDIFSLPNVKSSWGKRDSELNDLDKFLKTSERVYIQAPARHGKTGFISLFCDARKLKYDFYYYSMGESGITKMFEDIASLLESKKLIKNGDDLLSNPVDDIHAFIEKLFETKKGDKPILILDNAHYVTNPDDIKTIVNLAKKWTEIKLILIGDTMNNALESDFVEFSLGPLPHS